MDRALYGRLRLAIDPVGVRRADRDSESLVRWTGIREIGVSRAYVFLYLTDTVAIIVPRHAFPDKAAFRAFRDLACRYHEAATTAPFAEQDRPQPETYHAKDDRIRDGGPPGI